MTPEAEAQGGAFHAQIMAPGRAPGGSRSFSFGSAEDAALYSEAGEKLEALNKQAMLSADEWRHAPR